MPAQVSARESSGDGNPTVCREFGGFFPRQKRFEFCRTSFADSLLRRFTPTTGARWSDTLRSLRRVVIVISEALDFIASRVKRTTVALSPTCGGDRDRRVQAIAARDFGCPNDALKPMSPAYLVAAECGSVKRTQVSRKTFDSPEHVGNRH